MTDDNNAELNAETPLLFSIFDRAFGPTLRGEPLSEHETLVNGNCRILAWLGLVEPNSGLMFGYKPTKRLERLFAKQRAHPIKDRKQVRVSVEDADVLNLIFEAAVPDEDQQYVCPLAQNVLHMLGLVRYADQGVIPTRELRQLAAERREEERTQQLLKAIEAGEYPPR
jgi:hypothetical protein